MYFLLISKILCRKHFCKLKTIATLIEISLISWNLSWLLPTILLFSGKKRGFSNGTTMHSNLCNRYSRMNLFHWRLVKQGLRCFASMQSRRASRKKFKSTKQKLMECKWLGKDCSWTESQSWKEHSKYGRKLERMKTLKSNQFRIYFINITEEYWRREWIDG
jgi:hypothetical protein